MIKFMRKVKPQRYPTPIRTILNFIRYHLLIRQIYHKDENRELLAELMRDTSYSFNRGVEIFWTKYHVRHNLNRFETERKLRSMANNIETELEDMQRAQMRAEKVKSHQEKLKKEKEKKKRPEYVEGYKPTVNELLNRDTVLSEMNLGKFSYKLYDVKEKGAYVALILIEDGRPVIFCGKDYKKVRSTGFKHWLDLTKGETIKPYKMGEGFQKPKSTKSKQNTNNDDDFNIDIGHVERAMGINPNDRINDDEINDWLDELF